MVGGGLAWLCRQPLIVGYVLGGILISPLTPGPSVSNLRTFEVFAEIGVILLMFSAGLEVSLRDLARARWPALLGGPIAILVTIGLGIGAGMLLGWPLVQGAVVGMVVSVASTMVLMRLLIERGEMHARHGRIILATSLVEDLAVVIMIVAIPRLGAVDTAGLASIAGVLALAAGLLVPFTYVAARVIPPLLSRVARTRNPELFLLVALTIAIGTAALSHAIGLSLALGAFLAGVIIGESDYAHETIARTVPLRDAFVALFFVTIGALINPNAILEHLGLLAVILGLAVVGKFVVRVGIVRLFKYPLATAVLVGLGLAQIGEFSFVLIQVARQAGLVGEDLYQATLAASLLSILLNAALVRIVPGWLSRRERAGHAPAGEAASDSIAPDGHVVIAGFGRVGSAVAEALETFGTPYLAIELDPDIVKDLRARKVPCLYGDASQGRLLEAAGIHRAALVVVALPVLESSYQAVRRVRALNPEVPLLARAHETRGRDRLLEAGASEVIQPEVEAASTLIRRSLRHLDLPRERVLAYLERFRDAMEASPAVRVGGALPEVREVTGIGGGDLVGRSLRDGRIRERFGVTIIAITRASGEQVVHPTPDTILNTRDRVMVFGLPDQIETFAGELSLAPR